MKHFFYPTIGILLAGAITATVVITSQENNRPPLSEEQSALGCTNEDMFIKIEDPALAAAIRSAIKEQLGIEPTELFRCGDLSRLKHLDGSRRNIHSLEGIEYLTNLASLNLAENAIIAFEPLSALTQLQTLTLNNTGIINLSSIKATSSLLDLYIARNSIRELAPLTQFTKLTVLDITQNRISDIEPLNFIPGLASGEGPRVVFLHRNPLDYSMDSPAVKTLAISLPEKGVTPKHDELILDFEARSSAGGAVRGKTIYTDEKDSVELIADPKILKETRNEQLSYVEFYEVKNGGLVALAKKETAPFTHVIQYSARAIGQHIYAAKMVTVDDAFLLTKEHQRVTVIVDKKEDEDEEKKPIKPESKPQEQPPPPPQAEAVGCTKRWWDCGEDGDCWLLASDGRCTAVVVKCKKNGSCRYPGGNVPVDFGTCTHARESSQGIGRRDIEDALLNSPACSNIYGCRYMVLCAK